MQITNALDIIYWIKNYEFIILGTQVIDKYLLKLIRQILTLVTDLQKYY